MFHLPRVYIGGRFGEVNPAGIAFYNRLIDSLLLKGTHSIVASHARTFSSRAWDLNLIGRHAQG